MRFNRLLLVLAVLTPLSIFGQDIHFTQFREVPVSINPAQTGLFNGTYRIGGLYRSQWFGGGTGTIKSGYQTPIIFIDLPIKGLRKQDWIGLGVNLYQDRTGIAALTNMLAGLNGAYHLGLDKKQMTVLSIGVQAAFVQRRIDAEKLRFQDGIIGNTTSVDVRNIDAKGKGYSDWGAGINLRSKMGKKGENVLNIGLSAEHLLQPKYNVITSTIAKLPLRLNIYASMDYTLNKTFMLYPAAIFRTAKNQSETMAQTMLGMKLDPKKNLIVKAGLGYRIGDAAQFLAGAEFGDFRAGLAYDFTASTLRKQTNIQDGFEIAVSYIGKIFKKQQPPPTILCPKY